MQNTQRKSKVFWYSLNSFLRVSTVLPIQSHKWQIDQFSLIVAMLQRYPSHNYSVQTQRAFAQDWMNSFWIALSALCCLLYRCVMMNALEGECFCLREISINVTKTFMFLLAELLLPVYLFIPFYTALLLLAVYLIINFF